MIGGRLEAFLTVPASTTITATNSGGSGTSVSLTAGTYTPTSFVAHLVARLNAVRTPANWSGSLSVGTSGTGLVTLNCTGTWDLTFATAAVGTVLGVVGNIASRSSAFTGTQNARGLWFPDCPLNMEGDPDRAPMVSDLRTSESPTGDVIGLVGNTKYRHRNLSYSHISRARCWEGSTATSYATWETWFKDSQLGVGHSWFTPSSAFQIYWDNNGTDRLVGYDMNAGLGPTNGWKLTGMNSIEPKTREQGWIGGYYTIEIPQIVTSG